jgi:hypothetical protein
MATKVQTIEIFQEKESGIGLVVMVFLMRIRKASAASGKISK